MLNANAIWIEIKNKLRNELEESVFDDYFLGIGEVYKEENNNVYLVVENAFYKKRIQNQYIDRMNALLDDYYDVSHKFYLITRDEVLEEEEKRKNKPVVDVFSKKNKSGLNPNFTFSNFVVGDSNRFAHRYAVLVSEQLTKIANPVYIFGNVGLGKTHLMQAIGNAVLESNNDARVLYIGAQDFRDEYIKSGSKPGGYDKFYEKFEDLDVLLVDDIQFIESSPNTQIEFFKIFERLSNNNKLIVLTSDRKSSDLTNIMPRLTSRFERGLSLDINKPDRELRVQILNSKLKQEIPNPNQVPTEVIEYIATICDNNVRQLEGCLKRFLFNCEAFNLEYNLENAKDALKTVVDFSENIPSPTSNEDIKKLIGVVCGYFKISEADFLSSSRKKELVYARQLTWYIMKNNLNLTYQRIGSIFGGKDHSTVMHGCSSIEDSIKISKETAKNVENVLRKMGKDPNAIF